MKRVLAYRSLGHTLAHLDPLFTKEPTQPLLTLEALGFTPADLDLSVSSRYFMGGKTMRLREMIAALQTTYASRIGAEFMHIESTRVRNWVRERLESRREMPPPSREAQRGIYSQLLAAESFERFLHTRYVGQKRSPWKAARRSSRFWKRCSRVPRSRAFANWSWAWPIAAGSTSSRTS